ncbi:3-oxoacid CoA-transferase subunit B [Candidatus Lucifugimonas marina]|uniref:3-oxoacid CoA-transferase subunit B n=1 Tax=Candidatus Lucifugimonas marina TaxID=3038979 RepID=A0AAJ5ZIN1_9CHLR|nr:3-oxoacid CoA-transferase subunit B [SAR202 cluster bacterium JH702]MDG0869379.1 3-oxoacid CoA-transferase subunit B [SAR202 cluster bacterium JH639]WFG36775.1 3-oxoacid CoA-transferase subunit B [SAR202 cluster bacterium JH545]WFG40709.1 3-oxoacid CoA-transferase subunit B [SAR202 cluster bacterium JH1073]
MTTLSNDPAPRLDRAAIAKRAARDLVDGSTVNLGIGIPAMCADFLPDGVELLYHAENGILGFKELSAPGEGDPNLMDAGGKFPKLVPGMAFFDSVESFSLIRGGHIDVTVLGALQVSRNGDLSNWMIPKRGIGSIGGAMDLAANAKKVIIAMEHNVRGDLAKIVDECTFPLTARACVDEVITDIAVIEIDRKNDRVILRETAPGWSFDDVQARTEARLVADGDVGSMA